MGSSEIPAWPRLLTPITPHPHWPTGPHQAVYRSWPYKDTSSGIATAIWSYWWLSQPPPSTACKRLPHLALPPDRVSPHNSLLIFQKVKKNGSNESIEWFHSHIVWVTLGRKYIDMTGELGETRYTWCYNHFYQLIIDHVDHRKL